MNRTQRLLHIGSRAQGNERGAWWVWAFSCFWLPIDIDQIAEQFNVSDDTVRNAQRAYSLYCDIRAECPELTYWARSMRKTQDKSKWEEVARFYAQHGSLGDALKDLQGGVELHVRPLRENLDEKYNGDPLPRELDKYPARLAATMSDIWKAIDKLGNQRGYEPARLARQAERAGKLWLARLERVNKALTESEAK